MVAAVGRLEQLLLSELESQVASVLVSKSERSWAGKGPVCT